MPFVEPRPTRPLAIRITPLIDVVFILLVFFMLTTRLLPVDLMEVSTSVSSRSGTTESDPLTDITILPGQLLEWRGATYTLNELVLQLSDKGISQVNMKTAPDASVQDFTLAMSTLKTRGIEPNWRREPGP